MDRADQADAPAGLIAPLSFAVIESTANWNERRKYILKIIGINYSSRYIPLMIDIVDNWAKNVKKNELIDLSFEISRITFRIFSKILFGRDIEKFENIVYKSPDDGSLTELSFEDCYFRYTKDTLAGFHSVKGKLIPGVTKYGWVEPYKSNLVNQKAVFASIRNFLAKSQDNDSVYRQILDSGKFDKEQIFRDMLALLFGGYDTTAHAVMSTLYCYKKYPQPREKLMEALKDSDLLTLDMSKGSSLKENFEN